MLVGVRICGDGGGRAEGGVGRIGAIKGILNELLGLICDVVCVGGGTSEVEEGLLESMDLYMCE